MTPRSAPPTRRLRTFAGVDLRPGAALRARSFWAGWGGGLTTLFTGVVMAALLVGWVLLWVNRPGGANIPLLTIGCVAFTLVIAVIVTLHNRLTAHWRLRQAEALFLTGVSHSLRTPIGAIRAAAQLLERGDLERERYDRLVRAIIQETRRLALRVDNVLETGRLEVERAAFGGEAVDVGALVQAVADELQPVIDNRDGTLQVSVDGHAPVLGDPRALRLMLDNLVDNGLNYADAEPHLTITMERRDDFVLVRISDRGLGFPGADAPNLFRRSFRGDTRQGGTGLGLPLARAIARGHGGELHLHSDGPKKGAVAEIWLPLRGKD